MNETTFATIAEAMGAMHGHVDDPCIDNERIAFLDDAEAMRKYALLRGAGCCGSDDFLVWIGGRLALIGCNYGH